jgi:hypothetical protein
MIKLKRTPSSNVDPVLQNEMAVPGDRSLSARAVAGSFGILAWISVSLRCYVRLKLVKSFGWDDGLMVVALVSTLSLNYLARLV